MALDEKTAIEILAQVRLANELSQRALDKAEEALIEVKAMQKSTHRIISVDPYAQNKEDMIKSFSQSEIEAEDEFSAPLDEASQFYDTNVDPMGQYEIPKDEKEKKEAN